MTILLTGGTGYIGSHIASVLLSKQHKVVIIDNLSNSSKEVVTRLLSLHPGADLQFIQGDVANKKLLEDVFAMHQIDGVIHLAGYKAVKESVDQPLLYYRNNIDTTLTLLETLKDHITTKLIFSSSATVYGDAPIPYQETMQIGSGITHPYGKTKFMIEEILKDTCAANLVSQVASLRYFNPIGAHPSGLLGEHPTDVPNNLMPYIQDVATGKRDKLHIFGDDYPTPDGTCLRDYIHVMDVADAHVKALEHSKSGYSAYNIGTGRATSVMELIKAFEQVNGVAIPYAVDGRRDGDLAEFYADVSLANSEFGWQASRTIEDACRDSWNFTKHLMEKEV